MSTNKFIFAILVSVAVYADAGISTTFTRDQLNGKWYNLAVVLPRGADPPSTCESFEVTARPGSATKFDEVALSESFGKPHRLEGLGRVENSRVFLSFPTHAPGESTYSVMEFSNGQEIILFDPASKMYSSLASRQATTVSVEALAAMSDLAREAGGKVGHIKHNC